MGRLDEISARVKAATPGLRVVRAVASTNPDPALVTVMTDADVTFIAHSRDDVEWLVEVAKAWEVARIRFAVYQEAINSGQAWRINDAYTALKDALADRLVKGESEE